MLRSVRKRRQYTNQQNREVTILSYDALTVNKCGGCCVWRVERTSSRLVGERLLTDVGDEINDRRRVTSETPASESTDDRYARFHRLPTGPADGSLARVTTICGNNNVIDHRLTATMPSTPGRQTRWEVVVVCL